MNSGASRQTAISMIDYLIKRKYDQIESLTELKAYLKDIPIGSKSEELIWSLLSNTSGGFYI